MQTLYGFSNLSNHAMKRLNERTNFHVSNLLALLDTHSYLSLGIETGSNKQHCLIYSESDDQHYVAIQDVKEGTVVTVLPIDYHQTLSWKIDAPEVAINDESLRLTKLYASFGLGKKTPGKIKLKVRYVNKDDMLRVETIKSIDASKFAYLPSSFIENQLRVLNIVKRWMKKKALAEVVDVYSCMGQNDTPCFVEQDVIEKLNFAI